MGQTQATGLADTSAALFLASLWMSTFVSAPVAFAAFPIMFFFFAAVLALTLFIRAFHIGMTLRNTAYHADVLCTTCFPSVWALETAISTAYIE